MQIFVGLGNPGTRYAGNRHNIGFMAVDRIAEDHGFSPWREKFQGQVAEGRLGEVILRAMVLFSSGADGNGQDLTDAIASFRSLGLEDLARRSALELMILDAERARR